jgi:hypothetical protein
MKIIKIIIKINMKIIFEYFYYSNFYRIKRHVDVASVGVEIEVAERGGAVDPGVHKKEPVEGVGDAEQTP